MCWETGRLVFLMQLAKSLFRDVVIFAVIEWGVQHKIVAALIAVCFQGVWLLCAAALICVKFSMKSVREDVFVSRRLRSCCQ